MKHREYLIVGRDSTVELEIAVEVILNMKPNIVPCGGVMHIDGKVYQTLVAAPANTFSSWFSAFMAMFFVSAVSGGAFAFIWWVFR